MLGLLLCDSFLFPVLTLVLRLTNLVTGAKMVHSRNFIESSLMAIPVWKNSEMGSPAFLSDNFFTKWYSKFFMTWYGLNEVY